MLFLQPHNLTRIKTCGLLTVYLWVLILWSFYCLQKTFVKSLSRFMISFAQYLVNGSVHFPGSISLSQALTCSHLLHLIDTPLVTKRPTPRNARSWRMPSTLYWGNLCLAVLYRVKAISPMRWEKWWLIGQKHGYVMISTNRRKRCWYKPFGEYYCITVLLISRNRWLDGICSYFLKMSPAP